MLAFARVTAQQQLHFASDDQLVHFRMKGGSDAKAGMQLVGSDEICVKGNMYDIVERHRQKDGSTEYVCFDDRNETQINAAFFRAMEKDDNSAIPFSKTAKAFAKMAETTYLYEQHFSYPSESTDSKAGTEGYYCLPHPCNPEYLTETPPPRVIVG